MVQFPHCFFLNGFVQDITGHCCWKDSVIIPNHVITSTRVVCCLSRTRGICFSGFALRKQNEARRDGTVWVHKKEVLQEHNEDMAFKNNMIWGIIWILLLMEEIRLTTWHVWNPVNNGIFTISTGARRISEPSTVVFFLFTLFDLFRYSFLSKALVTYLRGWSLGGSNNANVW